MIPEIISQSSECISVKFDEGRHDALSSSVGFVEELKGIVIGAADDCADNGMLSVKLGKDLSRCAVSHVECEETSVTAIAYADVSSGMMRIGEEPYSAGGEIVLVLMIDADMPVETMARAGVTVTEAIVASMQDLGMKYDSIHATGAVMQKVTIVRNRDGTFRHHCAGKHCKLGELIAVATMKAVKESALKCGTTMNHRRSISVSLASYGISNEKIAGSVGCNDIGAFTAKIIDKDYDPFVFSIVSSCLHIYDTVQWGLIPEDVGKDAIKNAVTCSFGKQPVSNDMLGMITEAFARFVME